MRRTNETLLEELSKLSDDELRKGLLTSQWRSKRAKALVREVLDKPKAVEAPLPVEEPAPKQEPKPKAVSAPKSSTKPVTKKPTTSTKHKDK